MAFKLLFRGRRTLMKINKNQNLDGNNPASNSKPADAGLGKSPNKTEQPVAGLLAKNAELVRVNTDLAASNRQLQVLLDNIPDRIYFKDVQSRFVKLNKALGKRLGVADPEQVIGKSDFDFQLPERAKEFYADEQRVMQTGDALINKTEKQIMPSGETSWTSTTKIPLRDSQGTVVGLVGINRDITKQKQAEEALQQANDKLEHRVQERTADLVKANEALRESQALYSSLVDQIPAGVFRKDAEGRYVFANATFCRLRSVKVGDVLGKLPHELIPITSGGGIKYPNRAQMVAIGEQDHKLIMETGKTIEEEEQYINPDGKAGYLHVVKSPVFGPDGTVVGSQAFQLDITERKRAEEALRKSEEELLVAKNAQLAWDNKGLANAQRQLQELLDNIPDWIYFKDNQSRIIKMGRSLARSMGIADPGAAVGKTDFDFRPPDQAREFFAEEQRIFKTGEPVINKTERQVLASGQTVWMSTTKVPLRDPRGTIVGLIGINRDITKQQEAEAALRQAHDNLELRVKEGAADLAKANQALQMEITRRKQAEEALSRNEEKLR
jgi:PAS domain S-box-containing protein